MFKVGDLVKYKHPSAVEDRYKTYAEESLADNKIFKVANNKPGHNGKYIIEVSEYYPCHSDREFYLNSSNLEPYLKENIKIKLRDFLEV